MHEQSEHDFPPMQISIYRGEAARQLLQNSSFLEDWQNLASQMKMVTVIQKPAFVLTWYEQYAEVFEPVLVVGRDRHRRLVGLLPLAYAAARAELAHAGAWQGEYHGWICTREAECDFLVQAMIAIKREFHLRSWSWRWMPPGANGAWLSSRELKKNGIFVSTIEQEPPVLMLNDESKIRKIRRNRSLKVKMNRYKRRGEFRLERIVSQDRAEKLFDSLVLQTDFRQMAVHGEKPFAEDPHKRDFYTARLRYPADNHFTVLWLDDRPLAYHFGASDETTVYLGLTGYDPTESKNSPGILLFVKLIEKLQEEGFQMFDLTPGEDEYKARLGSAHRKVVRPTFYFRRRDYWAVKTQKIIRFVIKGLLRILGFNPRRVKQKSAPVIDFIRRLRASTPRRALKEIARRIFSVESYWFFELNKVSAKEVFGWNPPQSRFQEYADLLLFQDQTPWQTQQDILLSALRHFSRGEKLVTFLRHDQLLCFGWMGQLSQISPEVARTIGSLAEWPEESVILYDIHSSRLFPNAKPILTLIRVMGQEAKTIGTGKVGLLLARNHAFLRESLEKIGFNLLKKVSILNLLGKQFRREQFMANPLIGSKTKTLTQPELPKIAWLQNEQVDEK